MDTELTLVFVYNADSGLLNSIKDLLHKNLRPTTYPCRLCAITYDNKGMTSEWKQFIDSLDLSAEFLHKDEFRERYPSHVYELPAAFIIDKNEIRPFITSVEMNGLNGLEDLIEMVRSRISHPTSISQ